MGKLKIEKLKEIPVYHNPWVKLYFDKVRFPNGNTGLYNRLIEGNGFPGVAILPLFQTHIGLITEYRYPIGKELLEIPRGYGESANSKHEAIRELAEETGIKIAGNKIIRIGKIFPNAGILATKVYLFVAKINRLNLDTQPKNFNWYSKDTVFSMIRKNEIMDAFTICAVLQAQLLRLI